MKYLIKIVFILSSVFCIIFTVVGWKAFGEKLPSWLKWSNGEVVPLAASLAVIVVPFYLNPPREFAEWLRKAKSKSSRNNSDV